MKQNHYIILIIILLLSVGIVQYFILKTNNDQPSTGEVKSEQIDISNFQLPDIETTDFNLIPTKSNNYTQPNILAKNYILIDAESGYPLIEQASDQAVPIASTTKIMTAVIALENYNLDDIVTVSHTAATQIGSDVYLQIDEQITVDSLLYALLVKSGNDAAYALAENMGFDEFVSAMNNKAQYLGMTNTKYKDPAGLNDEGRSTAKDLSTITAYALKNDSFKKYINTPEITITSIDKKNSHHLENSNRLIKSDEPLYYSAAFGVKTGYTPDAGHCLVAAARQDGRDLVGVVLNTYSNTNDASARENRKLLQWGFQSYIWN